MQSQEDQVETMSSPVAPNPAAASCRRKKKDDAAFFEDVKDHIDEFINASMEEHVTCFKRSMEKMFGMSKIVAKKKSEAQEVESVLPAVTK